MLLIRNDFFRIRNLLFNSVSDPTYIFSNILRNKFYLCIHALQVASVFGWSFMTILKIFKRIFLTKRNFFKFISDPELIRSAKSRVVDPDTDPGSGLDPYSIGSVDPDPVPYLESGSGSRRAKMTHKGRKKLVKVHVFKCWMASFES